jgi:hypothetical protein
MTYRRLISRIFLRTISRHFSLTLLTGYATLNSQVKIQSHFYFLLKMIAKLLQMLETYKES